LLQALPQRRYVWLGVRPVARLGIKLRLGDSSNAISTVHLHRPRSVVICEGRTWTWPAARNC